MRPKAQRTAWLIVWGLALFAVSCSSDGPGPQNRVVDLGDDLDLASLIDLGGGEELDVRTLPDRSVEEPEPDVVGGDGGPDLFTPDDPDVDSMPPARARDGNACERAADCRSGRCFTVREGYPAGMCTTLRCEQFGDPCQGQGTVCAAQVTFGSLCTVACSNNADCRDGYACDLDAVDDPAVGACLPIPEGVLGPDGDPCGRRNDCASLFCQPAPDYPGGHCTTFGCAEDSDCEGSPEAVMCLPALTGTSTCVRVCEDAGDCRDGYVCLPGPDGRSFCAPNVPDVIAFDDEVFDPPIVCTADPSATFEHTFAETPGRATLLAIARDGRDVFPTTFRDADGVHVDFGSSRNLLQGFAGCLNRYFCSLTLPWTEGHLDQALQGAMELRYQSTSDELCFHVVEDAEPGELIRVNLIFVGLSHLDATNVETDARVGRFLVAMRALLDDAGVDIEIAQYFVPANDLRERYRLLRTESEIGDMMVDIVPPIETWEEALTVNLYLVDDFVGSSLVGRAGGIPGPVGVHGIPDGGVFASTSGWGSGTGPEFAAEVSAHEIGHFVGLLHTSEFSGGQDPLSDTPYCDMRRFAPANCADRTNLMFPLAGGTNLTLSSQQGVMIRTNAFARPARPE
jgi:hypothetical protein